MRCTGDTLRAAREHGGGSFAGQRSSGAAAADPVLQVPNRPVNDLSRVYAVTAIVNTEAVIAVRSGTAEGRR